MNVLETNADVLEDHVCSLDELEFPPERGTTRIVVFSYEEVWSCDREVLDKVALTLNLPPFFLLQHLQYWGHQNEESFPQDLRVLSDDRPHRATSEVLSLEIGWTPLLHMFGMIASPATPSTGPVGKSLKIRSPLHQRKLTLEYFLVMVLVRNSPCWRLDLSPSARTPGPASTSSFDFSDFERPEEFWRSLSSMSPVSIIAANRMPHDFFCPWISGIRNYIAYQLLDVERKLGPFTTISDFGEESLENI